MSHWDVELLPWRRRAGTPPGGLVRYIIAAALARTDDGGAVVAIVLLVTTQDGSGSLTGLLRACITVPHLLGTFVSRRIYLADDGRKVIAFASVRKTIIRWPIRTISENFLV